MGRLVEIRDYLPPTNKKPELNGKSFGKRVTSIAASLALSVSAIVPFQISGTEQIPQNGWGGKCTISGEQRVLKVGQGVSVAECEANKKWYNAGRVYIDPARR